MVLSDAQNNDNKEDKKFVLVAEDDKLHADVYRIKLGGKGFDVEIVSDGAQLLDAARKRKPDLIVLDLVMPVKDGFETLKEIKMDENLKGIKVIVISNLGQDEDIKKAQELGVNEYFVKTDSTLQEIMDKIEEYLR